jgi:hypothetical protein
MTSVVEEAGVVPGPALDLEPVNGDHGVNGTLEAEAMEAPEAPVEDIEPSVASSGAGKRKAEDEATGEEAPAKRVREEGPEAEEEEEEELVESGPSHNGVGLHEHEVPEGEEHEACRALVAVLEARVAELEKKVQEVVEGIPLCPICLDSVHYPCELMECRHLFCTDWCVATTRPS